jgi:adenylylsulfate kinase-like enzyme
MVIWLIGVSGSGKSTQGKLLKEYIERTGRPCCLIDGDTVREFFENDLGYTKEDRISNIKRIIFGAHLLDEAGIATIVCNISPFETLRKFARKKIKGYNQIYLKKELTTCVASDVKNVYRNNRGKTDLVGIDIQFEEPGTSDLVVDIDRLNIEEAFAAIVAFLKKKHPGVFT